MLLSWDRVISDRYLDNWRILLGIESFLESIVHLPVQWRALTILCRDYMVEFDATVALKAFGVSTSTTLSSRTVPLAPLQNSEGAFSFNINNKSVTTP
jgi:hypothetical protein